MDFRLTEEHDMIARMVRDFAESEVAPVIKEAQGAPGGDPPHGRAGA